MEQMNNMKVKYHKLIILTILPITPSFSKREKSVPDASSLWTAVFIADSFGVKLFIEWRNAEDLGKRFGCFMIIEFSLNVFTEFAEFSDKIFAITVKGLKPATQPPLV